jgi:hypothetical protein
MVLVPEVDEEDGEELEEPGRKARSRKLVYLQKNEAAGNDIAGTVSLVLCVLALGALAMGWFANGWIYVGAVVISLIGFGVGFMARGKLRIADCTLNFAVLLPAVVVSALLLAGIPVTQRARAQANRPPIVNAPPDEPEIANEPASAPAPGPKWIDASKGEPVEIGEVMVKIGAVRMGVTKSVDLSKALDSLDASKILQPDNSGGVTEHPALLIEVQVGNPSETRKLEFKRWSKTRSGEMPRLTDNYKNLYKLVISAGSADLMNLLGGSGQSNAVSIMPVKTEPDILTFDPPVEKAKYLRLELPAENFGGRGTLYFQIPTSMIQPAR